MRGAQGLRFPDLVSQVCHHWRTVATNNAALWTWITIKRPSHCEATALYLIRAGTSALLDIEIEMRSGFWNLAEIAPTDWKSQLEYMSNLFEFLRHHDAGPDRWRTLSIWARQPEPLLEAIAFLHKQAAPALRCLALKWASKSMKHVEETRAIGGVEASLQSLVLSGPSAPNLRYVELTSVPWPFVLGRPSPLFTGLTSLSLTAATRLYSITKLTTLILGNPNLQSLQLSSGPDDLVNVYSPDHPLPCVSLPSLRSMSVQSMYNSDWILDILKAIRTPNLEKFTLATELYVDYPGEPTDSELMLLDYLSSGCLNGDTYVNQPKDGSPKSIYPSLRELDISRVGCYRNVLRRRAAAGHPIRVLELRGHGSWDSETRDAYIRALPDGLRVVECSGPLDSPDDESEVGNWEDEVDDEDIGGYFDAEDELMEGAELNLGDEVLGYEGDEAYDGYGGYEDDEVYEYYGEYEFHEEY
ncbi:hypothetical protein OPQ81_008363 [Rhizoctonia solani]|nr:hypothetical protein OPQ81_008363 [Rhizoctonia solani]